MPEAACGDQKLGLARSEPVGLNGPYGRDVGSSLRSCSRIGRPALYRASADSFTLPSTGMLGRYSRRFAHGACSHPAALQSKARYAVRGRLSTLCGRSLRPAATPALAPKADFTTPLERPLPPRFIDFRRRWSGSASV